MHERVAWYSLTPVPTYLYIKVEKYACVRACFRPIYVVRANRHNDWPRSKCAACELTRQAVWRVETRRPLSGVCLSSLCGRAQPQLAGKSASLWSTIDAPTKIQLQTHNVVERKMVDSYAPSLGSTRVHIQLARLDLIWVDAVVYDGRFCYLRLFELREMWIIMTNWRRFRRGLSTWIYFIVYNMVQCCWVILYSSDKPKCNLQTNSTVSRAHSLSTQLFKYCLSRFWWLRSIHVTIVDVTSQGDSTLHWPPSTFTDLPARPTSARLSSW